MEEKERDGDDFDETNYFECVKRFEELKDKYNVDTSEYCGGGILYIVTNKHANFYGYCEKWDMDCKRCEETFSSHRRHLF